MEAIEFQQQTRVLAEDQEEYLPLPVWQDDEETISCYKLSWLERFRMLCTGIFWLRQLHFGGPLQPQRPQLESPFVQE